MKRYISGFMAITAALAAGLWLSGCQEEILEEEVVPLEISYEAVEGVIPNGSATAVPEITSGEPSEFKISEMFHGETDYEGSEFTIDPETGTVSIQGADDTDTGEYLITITCVSGGRSYILKNALSVTFISGMPQISMSQRTINVKYEDLQTGSDAELATSQVNASGVAAAIEGYELRNVRFRGLDDEEFGVIQDGADGSSTTFFEISDEGVVSMVKGDGWALGTYMLDVKVNTESYGSEDEEGLISDALTVNVTAAEIVINYNAPKYLAPNLARTYDPTVEGPEDGGPQVEGYTISGITLDGADFTDIDGIFSIDELTGVVRADAPETITAGDYAVSVSYTYVGQTLEATDVLVIECRPGMPEAIYVSPSTTSIELPNLQSGSHVTLTSFSIMCEGESADITDYEIKNVSLDGSNAPNGLLSINASTGEITIVKSDSWAVGEYTVDIKVNTESFGTESDYGIVRDALTINVVAEKVFNYNGADASHKFATGWTAEPVSSFSGASYSIKSTSSAVLDEYVSVGASDGTISVSKGNQIPEGEYTVTVTVTSGGESMDADYSFEVTENPYYFTYFSYGNNLGLSEEETDGVSQFRVTNGSDLAALKPVISEDLTDHDPTVDWAFSVSRINALNGISVNKSTGALTFTSNGYSANAMGVAFVTATTTDPEDAGNTWSVTVPIFVDCSAAKDGVTVQYTPFALRINPSWTEPVRSNAPSVTGGDASSLFLDFRRSFNYRNLEGVKADGTPFESGSLNNNTVKPDFLVGLWDAYKAATNNEENYGSKRPVSFYESNNTQKSAEHLSASPCYVDGTDGSDKFSVVINPWLWTCDGGLADGVFYGQMTFSTDLDTINNGSQIFPFAIWFDKDFNE